MAEQLRERLKSLADELGIRAGPKLYIAAKRKGIEGVTHEIAKSVVAGDVGRQVLAPPYCSTGASASEGAGQRIQGDLIDLSKNTRTQSGAKYALLLSDVYTREARAVALPDKTPDAVNAALRPALANLTDGRRDYVLSVDKGREWTGAEKVMPDEAALRSK